MYYSWDISKEACINHTNTMTQLLSLIRLYESSSHDATVDDKSLVRLVEFIDNESLEDTFKEMPRDEKQQFVSILSQQIRFVVERNYISVSFDDAEEISDETVRAHVLSDLESLDSLVKLSNAFCKTIGLIDESFFECISMLNDILFAVGVAGSAGTAVQFHIALLLESFWNHFNQNSSGSLSISKMNDLYAFPNKDFLVNMMVYFLSKATDEESKSSDVKKCLQLKESLLEIEIDHFEKEIPFLDRYKLLDFLYMVFISPQFVHSAQGQKFLIFCLSQINPLVTIKLHGIVRDQIYIATEETLEVYADVYYKAWKSAPGQIKIALENDCIQNLMEAAILCRDKKLFSNIRLLLQHGFQNEEKKKIDEVDDMLLRLYEPILFRYICTANATVRRQASCLFVDVFPLRNPSADRSDAEQLLNRQLSSLRDIIEDEVPAVRCVGIQGVSQILKVYWDVIPSDDRYQYLKLLVLKYALDGSSTAVRLSVVKGIHTLLDNPLSHSQLKQLFVGSGGGFGKLIHDGAIAVRKEFLNLLLHVKSIKSISIIDIVSEADIVRRLCVDGSPVRDQITQLLLNSYFAYDKKGSDQFHRFKELVSSNSYGAKLFYESAVKYVPSGACCRFLKMIIRLLSQCIVVARSLGEGDEVNSSESNDVDQRSSQSNRKRRKVNEVDTSKSSTDSTRDSLKQLCQDLPFMETTIEIVSILVEQINSVYPDDEENVVASLFDTSFLMDLKSCFKTNRIQSAIWKICKFLPEERITEFSQNCLVVLESMCEEGMLRSDMSSILECIVQWNQTEKLLDLIHAKLNVDGEEGEKTVSQRGNSRRKRRKIVNQVNTPLPQKYKQAYISLHFLNALMQNESLRKLLIAHDKQGEYPIKRIHELLQFQISDKLTSVLTNKDVDQIEEQYFIAAFHSFGKLMLHLSCHDIVSNNTSTTSKRSKDRSSEIATSTPKYLATFLTICSDTLLPVVELACEEDDIRVKETLQPVRRAKKRKNKDDESNKDEEAAQSEEEIPYYHMTVCLCRSICMVLCDSISLGVLRQTQTGSTDTVSGIVFSFLRKSMSSILYHSIGDICKILYTLLNKGWDQEAVIGIFKEVVISSSTLLEERHRSDEDEDFIRILKLYLQKLLQLFSTRNLDHHIAFTLYNSAIKELEESQPPIERLLKVDDTSRPPLTSLITELVSEASEEMQREVLKKILVSVQTLAGAVEMPESERGAKARVVFSSLQVLSLLLGLASPKRLAKVETTMTDLVEVLTEFENSIDNEIASAFNNINIANEIASLIRTVNDLSIANTADDNIHPSSSSPVKNINEETMEVVEAK